MAAPLVWVHTAGNIVDAGQMSPGSVEQQTQVDLHVAGRIACAQPGLVHLVEVAEAVSIAQTWGQGRYSQWSQQP